RGEELAPGGIVDSGDDRLSIDLERGGAAVDRQTVCVIRRPIHRIEHPAVARFTFSLDGKFFREDRVVAKTLRDERAEHPLDVTIDLRDEIDRSFLLDMEVVGTSELHGAGLHDR